MTILSLSLTCMAFIPSAENADTLQCVYGHKSSEGEFCCIFDHRNSESWSGFTFCWGIHRFGVYAIAGVSSSLTIVRNLLITAPYTAKLLELPWYEFYKDVGISLLCCALNLVAALVVQLLIPARGWVLLAVAVIVTCGITLAADLFVVLNQEERKKLINKVKRGRKNG
ncbi:MAG: hypothetical protein ACLT9S_01075 [Faecalibacterium sp.]